MDNTQIKNYKEFIKGLNNQQFLFLLDWKAEKDKLTDKIIHRLKEQIKQIEQIENTTEEKIYLLGVQ